MARIVLVENTFTLIPEGITTFKVMGVDDSKYEDFGKLEVKLQTADGKTHMERFSLIKANGEVNNGAIKAWSYFARTCLNDFNIEEIDTQDIVGCFITATVKHEKYTRTKGEKAGQEAIAVRLNDYTTASGFKVNKVDSNPLGDDFDDLDSI